MEINQVKIEFVHGKLSDIVADAYILPYFPHHVNPDFERQDVENAGARGVRRFVEHRLRHELDKDKLRMGDISVIPADGGKSKFLVNIVCRSKDTSDCSWAIQQGLLRMLNLSGLYSLRHVAMTPLCVSDGLSEQEFAKVFQHVLETCSTEHTIRQITIVCKDVSQQSKLSHICE